MPRRRWSVPRRRSPRRRASSAAAVSTNLLASSLSRLTITCLAFRTLRAPTGGRPRARRRSAPMTSPAPGRAAHGSPRPARPADGARRPRDRKSTRLNSSHVRISYAVFCLKKKKKKQQQRKKKKKKKKKQKTKKKKK